MDACCGRGRGLVDVNAEDGEAGGGRGGAAQGVVEDHNLAGVESLLEEGDDGGIVVLFDTLVVVPGYA